MEYDLLFLDIDGVLNPVNSLIRIFKLTKKGIDNYNYQLDFKCVEMLVKFIKTTGVKIVLSSDWRRYQEAIDYLIVVFNRFNLPNPFIGITPSLKGTRADEFRAFLATFPYKIRSIVVLDDRKDTGEFSKYQAVTDSNKGVTRENMKDLYKIHKINLKNWFDSINKCRRLEYGFY